VARAGADTELSAVLLGGYGGAWLDAAELAVPYAPGPLNVAGTSQGVGVIVALPRTSCGVAETARIARYMAGESVGQCGPCIFGLPAIADDLEQLWAGGADAEVVDRIQMRAATVEGRGACRHPDGVVRLVRSALVVFAADTLDHAQGRPCPGHASPTVLSLPGGAAGTRRSA
jgi:NADH:ubiquinone oxidoreductase subunit F (NADH-binding)